MLRASRVEQAHGARVRGAAGVVRRRFPALCGWVEEPELQRAMSEALDPDWFIFFPEHVSVTFPPGSLPGEENGYGISLNYKDAPEGFFQPWAIPQKPIT